MELAVYKTPWPLEAQKTPNLKLEAAIVKCTEGVDALARSQYHPAYEPATKEEETSG
jgi:hypothetical protein